MTGRDWVWVSGRPLVLGPCPTGGDVAGRHKQGAQGPGEAPGVCSGGGPVDRQFPFPTAGYARRLAAASGIVVFLRGGLPPLVLFADVSDSKSGNGAHRKVPEAERWNGKFFPFFFLFLDCFPTSTKCAGRFAVASPPLPGCPGALGS